MASREELLRQDAEDLKRLGYAQQLLREMGGFSNFAVSFSVISILTGAVAHVPVFGSVTSWYFQLFVMVLIMIPQVVINVYGTLQPAAERARPLDDARARGGSRGLLGRQCPCALPRARVRSPLATL